MPAVLPIPTGPQIDARTGALSEEWRRYYQSLEDALAGATAPRDAQYWVSTLNPDLTNERNLGALADGFVKVTVAAGVATPSTVATVPMSSVSGIVGLAQGGTGSDLSATGGAGQVLKQTAAGATVTVGALATTDISGLASGTFTPTTPATFGINLTGLSPRSSFYQRIGSIVMVSGSVGATITASGAECSFVLSLPVASGVTGGLWGVGACGEYPATSQVDAVYIRAASSGSAKVAEFEWWATRSGAVEIEYSLGYVIT